MAIEFLDDISTGNIATTGTFVCTTSTPKFTNAIAGPTFTIEQTLGASYSYPTMVFLKTLSSGGSSHEQDIGQFRFSCTNISGVDKAYTKYFSRTLNRTAGTESAQTYISMLCNGAEETVMKINGGAAPEFIIGNDSASTPPGILKISDGSANSVGFKTTAALTATTVYTLPSADGTANQVLSTDGSLNLSWATGGSGGTNIANTNLTADASRTLTLGGYSLSFLDSNADNIAVIQATGNQFFGGTFSIRTHSTTTAPTLRLASGTSSKYTGIKSPDTLAASVVYILPTGYGNAGDVLSVEAAGASTQQMKWTGGGADVILSGGGKVEMTTSSDASARALLFGGADGFNDSNWNVLAGPNSPGSSLGTPGTTTLSCDPVSVMNALFRSPKSGDINISGTVKFSAGTNSSTNTFVRVYKVPAAFVTDMENGDDPGTSISCTLVAAIQVDTPSLNVDTRPRNYISTNGVSISSGDYVFATYSYRGRLTSTQYFTHNFQLLLE